MHQQNSECDLCSPPSPNQVSALEGALAGAQAEGAERAQLLRGRLGASTAQQSEMLRTAQRICQEAEERADTADTCA